jgi:hypothetical protein
MAELNYSKEAAAWVNLLVPGHFAEAAAQISNECVYQYNGENLTGPAVIGAFLQSHERAKRDLDEISYWPATCADCDENGALVKVADQLTLNGQTHVYNDRLRIRMQPDGERWKVIGIEHLPIPEEREGLKEFLRNAGLKRTQLQS